MVDQQVLNTTNQEIIVLHRDGIFDRYNWTLQDGPSSQQPFAFDDVQ